MRDLEYIYIEIVRNNILKAFDVINELQKAYYQDKDHGLDIAWEIEKKFNEEVLSNWHFVQEASKKEIESNLYNIPGTEENEKKKRDYVKKIVKLLSENIENKIKKINNLNELKLKKTIEEEKKSKDKRNLGRTFVTVLGYGQPLFQEINSVRNDLLNFTYNICKSVKIDVDFLGICDELKIDKSLIGIKEETPETEINSSKIQIPQTKVYEKLNWLGTPSQFGYFFYDLVEKGFIEFPQTNGVPSYSKYAKICMELFNIFSENKLTTKGNLEKELNPEKCTLGETNRKKIKIPFMKELQ